MFVGLLLLCSGGKPGLAPAGELLFFASPKKSNQKKGEPRPCRLRGPLRYSQRSGHLQTRFAQTVQVPSSERCSVAQHGLMAGDTSRLVRFANFAPVARSLRSPRGGWGFLISHASLLSRARHAVPLQLIPSFLIPPRHSGSKRRTQTSSFRAQSRNPCFPALQLGCCDYAQHDGMCRAPLPPSPTPFPVFPHSSLLTPHSYDLTPHDLTPQPPTAG